MKKFTKILTILALASQVAFGDTITNIVNYQTFSSAGEAVLPVSQFNPAYGTLNSASVSATLAIDHRSGLENKSGLAGVLKSMIFATNTISFGSNINEVPLTKTNTFQARRFDGVVDYAGTSGTNILSSVSNSFILPADLNSFIGISSVLFTNQTSAIHQYQGNAASSVLTETSHTISIQVIYDFTPVE